MRPNRIGPHMRATLGKAVKSYTNDAATSIYANAAGIKVTLPVTPVASKWNQQAWSISGWTLRNGRRSAFGLALRPPFTDVPQPHYLSIVASLYDLTVADDLRFCPMLGRASTDDVSIVQPLDNPMPLRVEHTDDHLSTVRETVILEPPDDNPGRAIIIAYEVANEGDVSAEVACVINISASLYVEDVVIFDPTK